MCRWKVKRIFLVLKSKKSQNFTELFSNPFFASKHKCRIFSPVHKDLFPGLVFVLWDQCILLLPPPLPSSSFLSSFFFFPLLFLLLLSSPPFSPVAPLSFRDTNKKERKGEKWTALSLDAAEEAVLPGTFDQKIAINVHRGTKRAKFLE